MRIKQLIEMLSKLPDEAEVEIWDYEDESVQPVASYIWNDEGSGILLIADDPEG